MNGVSRTLTMSLYASQLLMLHWRDLCPPPRLTRLLVVVGFDAADVGRILWHEDSHQLCQTGLELEPSLKESNIHTALVALDKLMYEEVFVMSNIFKGRAGWGVQENIIFPWKQLSLSSLTLSERQEIQVNDYKPCPIQLLVWKPSEKKVSSVSPVSSNARET